MAGRLAPPCGQRTRCREAGARADARQNAALGDAQARRSPETEQVSVQEQRGIGTGEISIALQLHARRGWYGTDWTISGFVVRPECWAGRAAGVWVRSTMRRCPLPADPWSVASARALAWLDVLQLMLTANSHPPVRPRVSSHHRPCASRPSPCRVCGRVLGSERASER